MLVSLSLHAQRITQVLDLIDIERLKSNPGADNQAEAVTRATIKFHNEKIPCSIGSKPVRSRQWVGAVRLVQSRHGLGNGLWHQRHFTLYNTRRAELLVFERGVHGEAAAALTTSSQLTAQFSQRSWLKVNIALDRDAEMAPKLLDFPQTEAADMRLQAIN